MTEESSGIDPYETVLADLKAKRDQINQAIAAIEALRGGAPMMTPNASPEQPAGEAAEGRGAFLGMSIPDATKKLLRIRKQAMANKEIVAALEAGGMAMGSRDKVNTVGSVLGRRFDQVGDIVRVSRGTWGLAEWYPGRSFKKRHPFSASDDPAEQVVGEAIDAAGEDD